MKIRFTCDSGANIKSNHESEWLDPVEDLGMKEGEWERMTNKGKYLIAKEWAWENGLEINYEEQD